MSRYAAIGLLIACALVACGRRPSIEKSYSSVLRIATSFKIQRVDPIRAGHYFLVEFGVVELPLIYDDTNGITPWLLESYERIDDLNWRLTLRPNVQFQNGKPLNADKFAAAMSRQLAHSPVTRTVMPGAKVTVTSEREIILTTSQPDPTVPAALADEAIFPIYDVESVEAAGTDAVALLKSYCYTGPYRILSLDDRELRLEANKTYWRGLPKLSGVTVRFVPEAQARILAVQNNEVDVALYPPTEASRMLANHNDAFFVTNSISRGGPSILFNIRRPPFDETAVRRAFSLGINYETLARDVMDGVAGSATGFYPPSFPWALQNQRTDVEESRRLLTEAGWLLDSSGIRFHKGEPLEAVLLVYPQQPDFKTIATAIQGQLSELGFRLRIQQVDDIDAAMKNSSDWNAAIYSRGVITTGGAPEPILRDYLLTNGEENDSGISDSELDRLIEELSRSFETNRRSQLLASIQDIVIEKKAYEVRVMFSRSKAVVGRTYRNYKPSPSLHHVTYDTKPDDQ
jgi:peptide/nickel transport system substrate-binding protein